MTLLTARLRPTRTYFWLVAASFFAVLLSPVCGEEEAPAAGDAPSAETTEENDETKQLLKQLTIAMTSEILDERTVVIRNTGSQAKKRELHLRLGNTGAPARGSLSDGEYAEKVKVAKEALTKLVEKQMIWYKAAPESLQAPSSSDASTPDVVVADIWSIDGKHIATALKGDGHLDHSEEYESELGKDILTAAAEEEKKESYKKLEEALKESEKAKQEAAKAAREQQRQEEEENVEGFGLAGWLGIAVVLVLVVGVATNFGRPGNKKVNLNRKKGPLEKFWMKLKGA